MPYVKIWIHCVWGTKNRIKYLQYDVKNVVIDHIRNNARAKNIYIDFINGYTEHLHCLISLRPEQSLSGVMQLLKGESSFWINKNKLTSQKFEWADEYYGASVSDSHVKNVREYIKNQEIHHLAQSWPEEEDELILKNGFDKSVD